MPERSSLALFDACSYIGRWPTEQLPCQTAQGLLAEMDRLGIARALVAHTLAWQDSPAYGNRLLMQEIAGLSRLEPCWVILPGETWFGEAALQHPSRAPRPNSRGAEAGTPLADPRPLCEQMAGQGVRAVRLCPRDHVYPLSDWLAGDMLAALAERHYLLLLDLDQVVLPTGLFDVDPAGWDHIAWLCGSFPQLSIVLTKVGYRAMRILPRLMRRHANLHADISYFSTHLGVEEIVAHFGSGRLLFGTNQPLTDPGGAITRLAYADISAEQRDQIAHGNLERLLDRVQAARPATASKDLGSHAGPSVGSRSTITIRKASSPASLPVAPPSGAPNEPEQPDAVLPRLVHAGISLAQSGLEIFDAHIHLGPYRNFYIPDPSAEAILDVMDRCGIAQAGMSSTMAVGPDWITGNRLTAEAVAAHADRFVGHVVANPSEPALIRSELTRAFDELGFVAVKLHPDLHAHPIEGPGYEPAWEFAAERGCPLFSHTFHGSRFCDPSPFGTLAERYPQVPIILVHSGSQTAAFQGAIRLAQEHGNIYLDLSGSFSTGQWIRRIVRKAGADRVLWSSDIPFIDALYSLGRVVFAQLTREEQALVLGGNVRRLLGL